MQKLPFLQSFRAEPPNSHRPVQVGKGRASPTRLSGPGYVGNRGQHAELLAGLRGDRRTTGSLGAANSYDVIRRNRIDWLWTALLAVVLAAPFGIAWVLGAN